MKILVVDDERFNLAMAKDIIAQNLADSEIILCNSPEKVMAIMAENMIDIVVLDINMPNINGIEILRMIRSNTAYKDIQVIMFTGVTDKQSFKDCFEYGANDFINKPINITEFITRIRAAAKTRKNMLTLTEMYNKTAEQYKKLEEVTQQLNTTQLYLLQSEKLASLGEIAAGVAHEINNPIGFVSSNLDTMEKYLTKIEIVIPLYKNFLKLAEDENINRQMLLDEKQRIEQVEEKQKIDMVLADLAPIIQESKAGVDRVTKIVQSLRNFARTGAEDDLNVNNFNHIIEEALLITKNELKYHTKVEKRLNPLPDIICNKNQIEQVLVNILVNAAQAIKSQTRSDMGNIFVETRHSGDYIICEIRDDGPGIKPEHLNRVFDPFFTTKEVGSGTGLGLSIAYGIIKKHNGELIVHSKLGQGASFVIKLPLAAEN